jgi:hypothetical protein
MDLDRITEEVISELTKPEDIDLSSFKVRDTLNPKIFDEDQKLKPEIRTRLLMIADDFFETLDIPWTDVEDVTLTGSLSNYNWSRFSDVDLHILIDYKEIGENSDLVSEYLMAKKNLWNEKHDITIKGYDVEVYAQNIEEEHISTGVYSILWDDWLVKPKKGDISIDAKKVRQKAASIIGGFDTLMLTYHNNEYDKVIRRIQNLKTKIKKLRQTGLDREGEYSYENITFKVLRRVGLLDKLSDLETLAYDKSLSL